MGAPAQAGALLFGADRLRWSSLNICPDNGAMMLASIRAAISLSLFGFFQMGTIGIALVVGGMALLFSGLIFLLPFSGKRPPPRESFEDSQHRIEQYLREIRRNRSDT